MKYEITEELRGVVINIIVNADIPGLNYLKVNGLIKQLQQLKKVVDAPAPGVPAPAKVMPLSK